MPEKMFMTLASAPSAIPPLPAVPPANVMTSCLKTYISENTFVFAMTLVFNVMETTCQLHE